MIHMKSLIRRLDCVPWLLAACALVWAGEAQANRLAVNPDTDDGTEGVQYHDIKLELDTHEVLENALTAGDDPPPEVQITVTATRLKEDGAAKDDDAAANDAAVQISLSSVPGAGTVVTASDPALLNAAAAGTSTRYRISMPFLVIPKGKAQGTAIISFVPIDNDAEDGNGERGVAAGDADVRVWILGDDGVVDTDDANQTIRSAYFTLRDDERDNGAVTLSFSVASLSKEADRTKVTVTATLDAKPAEHDLEFGIKDVSGTPGNLVADTATPNVEDEGFTALASSDRIASRDAYYTGTDFGNIKIEKGKMSATKDIYIDPVNVNDALIIDKTWIALGSEDSPVRVNPDGLADSDGGTPNPEDSYDLPIIPGFIQLTKDALPKVDKVAEISPQVREDGGPDQEVTVRVSLKEAAPAGGITVSLDLVEEAGRDTDYYAEIADSRLVIAEGQKSGDATVLITPIDNEVENSDWTFKVSAGVAGTGDITSDVIKIVDDEDAISEIELRADPATISEIDGETTVTITAYVIGKGADAAIEVPLTIVTTDIGDAAAPTAHREVDYRASLRTLTIPAGDITATQEITITPVADETDDGDGKTRDETLLVGTTVVVDANRIVKVGDKNIPVEEATITLKDEKTPADDPPTAEEAVAAIIALPDDLTVSGTVDTALEAVLPEGTGSSVEDEDTEVTYLLSGDLPAGLSFDSDARTISGTPTAAGEAELTYYATDGTNLASSTVTITIAEAATPDVLLEGISSTHTSIRENGGEASITLTVELEDAAGAGGEDVTLTIGTPTEGSTARRDVDFDATLQGSITIAEGATSGTATLTVTPHDNTTADGHKAFGVEATSSSGHSAIVNIGISDNESASQGIALSVYPDEVSEGTSTDVTVTASLDGRASDSDVTVSISIGASSSATRDVDYSAVFDGGAEVTIAAGDISGSATVTITAGVDDDGDETIVLVGSADGLGMGSAAITLVEGTMVDDGDMDDGDMDDGDMDDGDMDDGMMAGLHFTGEVADQAYTAGTAIADLVVPEATGGEGDVTYRAFDLPAGLTFDADHADDCGHAYGRHRWGCRSHRLGAGQRHTTSRHHVDLQHHGQRAAELRRLVRRW